MLLYLSLVFTHCLHIWSWCWPPTWEGWEPSCEISAGGRDVPDYLWEALLHLRTDFTPYFLWNTFRQRGQNVPSEITAASFTDKAQSPLCVLLCNVMCTNHQEHYLTNLHIILICNNCNKHGRLHSKDFYFRLNKVSDWQMWLVYTNF